MDAEKLPYATKELRIDWVLVSWWVCKQSQNFEKPGGGLIIIPQRNSFKKRLGFLGASVLKACRMGKCEKKKTKQKKQVNTTIQLNFLCSCSEVQNRHIIRTKVVKLFGMFKCWTHVIVLVCVWVREMIYFEIEKIRKIVWTCTECKWSISLNFHLHLVNARFKKYELQNLHEDTLRFCSFNAEVNISCFL